MLFVPRTATALPQTTGKPQKKFFFLTLPTCMVPTYRTTGIWADRSGGNSSASCGTEPPTDNPRVGTIFLRIEPPMVVMTPGGRGLPFMSPCAMTRDGYGRDSVRARTSISARLDLKNPAGFECDMGPPWIPHLSTLP